jgi:hypothetical protein
MDRCSAAVGSVMAMPMRRRREMEDCAARALKVTIFHLAGLGVREEGVCARRAGSDFAATEQRGFRPPPDRLPGLFFAGCCRRFGPQDDVSNSCMEGVHPPHTPGPSQWRQAPKAQAPFRQRAAATHFAPPAMKLIPSTKSMLDRMEPSREVDTTW